MGVNVSFVEQGLNGFFLSRAEGVEAEVSVEGGGEGHGVWSVLRV
jgi:hypothetical protein